uniref:Chromosome 15 open reading frame 39 n=1 Tax=Calidris pygmaea TaxID=425635 RepID=A0A8C3K8D0_9CHAR
MASKRHLESLDPVIFNKLPRLETEPAATFCKSSPVPNPAPENHFNYKGSYFACPLQSPDGPEQPLGHWNPAATYLHYGPGTGNQPVPAEGPLVGCLLYRPESLGTGLQPPPAAPLAVPKPVYRPPACFVDPRVTLPLGPRVDNLQQRPGDTDWGLPATAAAPPASHPLHPGDTGLHKRGPHSEHSLLPLHPSLVLPTKEKVGSPLAFSPYYTAFEKYRGNPLLEAGCPTAHGQRKVPEVPSLSPDPWPKLQPPVASPAYRERPPACYPHTHYPLPLHKAAFLYHPPPPPTAEPQPYKGFGFVGSGEPFPGSYLKPQAPRSFFPSPLDTYVPRVAGAVASPPGLPRDAEPPRRAGYLPSPGFAFSPGDTAVSGTSFAGAEPESPRRRDAGSRHNSAFQPVCTPEKVPEGSGEGFPKGERSWVKPSPGEQDPTYRPGEQDPTYHPGRRTASPELIPPSPATSPQEGLKAPRESEVSPSSPPMPVINNVFSLAPYRDYLEGTEGSARVPFCRDLLPVLEKPNPGGVRSGDPPPEDIVLDLSLKKKAGETQGPVSRAEGTPDTGDVEEEKDGPGGKVRVGEGAKPGGLPLLIEVGSGDKSNFQSSATFMFKKYKILRSRLPTTPSPPAPAPSGSIPAPPQTLPASPPASSPPAPQVGPSALQGARPDPQQPPLPEAPRVVGEESILLAGQCEPPGPQTSAGQYFSSLHTLLCDVISCSVSRSSPELLREWLKKAEKPTKGKEIWLAFQDVPTLLTNLLSQLETFMFARKCPFPHVVRAGAVFIPIHVVKEKLFPKLPGASVDQVLQEHKVELRPTTLSEERHLRDLELKSCTSRMLKLLALKQLPDIYPDLLNLYWHDSIRQQLGRGRREDQGRTGGWMDGWTHPACTSGLQQRPYKLDTQVFFFPADAGRGGTKPG